MTRALLDVFNRLREKFGLALLVRGNDAQAALPTGHRLARALHMYLSVHVKD
ncbi:MAG TPA: hypothetical protein VFP93_02685 [Gammaproteobacteria bacterium]|nr:hypothetical protein [Gammaproteobacteria bacterium]